MERFLENKMELVMKNTKFALLFVVAGLPLSLAVSSAAFAQDDSMRESFYLSFGGGASFPSNSNVDFRNSGALPKVNGNTSFDTGYMLSGAAGYRWMSGMRTELELNYRKSNVDSIAGADASGSQRVLGVMGNVLFDIGNFSSFRPYVGGGAGVGWNKWSNVRGNPSATFPVGTALYNERDPAFQWQGIAGVSRAFTDRMEGFVEYRYIGLEQNKFQGTVAAAASRHNDRSHNALIGIRYNF